MALRVKRHNFTACFVVDKGARYITPPLIWVSDTWGSERCPNLWPLGGNLKKSIPWFTPHCPHASFFGCLWFPHLLKVKLSVAEYLFNPDTSRKPWFELELFSITVATMWLKRMWAQEVNEDWQRGQNKSNIMSSFKSRRGKRGLGNILERLENWEKCLKSTERVREK